MKGMSIHWLRRSLGIDFPDFHPNSIFQWEGFLSLFILDQLSNIAIKNTYYSLLLHVLIRMLQPFVNGFVYLI